MSTRKFHRLYKQGNYKSGVCVYCGEDADTKDHIPPMVILHNLSDVPEAFADTIMKSDMMWVPACMRCNATAGDAFHLTVGQRWDYLHKLRIKQTKVGKKRHGRLSHQDWIDRAREKANMKVVQQKGKLTRKQRQKERRVNRKPKRSRSDIAKALWENPEYSRKVISGLHQAISRRNTPATVLVSPPASPSSDRMDT